MELISFVVEFVVRYIIVYLFMDFYIECFYGILFDVCYVDFYLDGVFCVDFKIVVIFLGSFGLYFDVLFLMRFLVKVGYRVIIVNFLGWKNVFFKVKFKVFYWDIFFCC